MIACTTPTHAPNAACGCAPLARGLARRGMLGLLAAGALALPRGARAATGTYQAMLLNCIDPRFTTGSLAYMTGRGLRDQYSQFTMAGGPIGAVHPRFAAWHVAFWENLAVSVELHRIHSVLALTHRDCGAARIAFGDAAVTGRAQETATHAEALRAFRAEAARRQPALTAITGIMDLDGSVEIVS